MDLNALLIRLQDMPFAQAISQSGSAFPWIESVHVLTASLVVGTVAIVDLRLLGVLAHHRSIKRLSREILPITWIAFALATITGALMFSTNAVKYAANIAFEVKLVLLLIAGLNMLYFEFVTARGVDSWDEFLRPPVAAKIAGVCSLAVWIGVVGFGRWIGFVDVGPTFG